MSLQTANWNYLGNQFYKKFEICHMLWGGTFNTEDYVIAAASFGGPIALMTIDNAVRKILKPFITIYNSMGDRISSFPVEEDIVQIGWSNKEELICLRASGFVSIYDLFGQHVNSITLDQEIRDARVMEGRIFNCSYGTGLAILTNSYRFYLYNNIYDLKIRRLAVLQDFNKPPSCWEVIVTNNETQLVVSKGNKELVILNSQDFKCMTVNLFDDKPPETIMMMSVSFDFSHICFFTETGKLILVETANNITNQLHSVFDTECKTKPKQIAWCANDAVACHWANLILFVDLNRNYLKYPTYSTVHMIQEIDCIRVVDEQCQELIKKVENVEVEIFKIGSFSSGANLLEASRLFEKQSHQADDYIRLIQEKNEMNLAVQMCLEAASHEFNIPTQKMLLRAALFGKSFTNQKEPRHFVEICQRLKILNAIHISEVGIPLTYRQLEVLSVHALIDRLIERRHFLLALRIASYLKIAPELGDIKILTHWAFYKVRQKEISEEQIANDIANKLQHYSGVSYAEIANHAIEYGRKNLAIKLLDYEHKPTDQVPLLLKLKQYLLALQRAIESGDTNLVNVVILKLKESLTSSEFFMAIRNFPAAYALYQKYCKTEDPEKLRNIYLQEDDFVSVGLCYLEQSLNTNHTQTHGGSDDTKKQKVSLIFSALDTLKKSREEFLITHSEEHLRLLKYQLKLEEKMADRKFFGLSVQDTLKMLLCNKDLKLADELKKDFKVPDRRYYHLKLMTFAQIGEWEEMEKLSRAKKSPIGYEPFVDVCIKYRNLYDAQKYLPKVREENKIKYLVKTGNFEEAAKFALEKKDREALEYILSKCSPSNRTLNDKVRSMLNQLK